MWSFLDQYNLIDSSNREWLTIEQKTVAGAAFHLDNEPKLAELE